MYNDRKLPVTCVDLKKEIVETGDKNNVLAHRKLIAFLLKLH